MSRWTHAARPIRALVLLSSSLLYLAGIFQIATTTFWTNGLGDWMDPYFINYLLEHWHHSVWHFRDPSSPPMYFPAKGTLGYSHGLVLYAPFYLALRLFFHPFQAYGLTLFLVMEIGIVCLYVLIRKSFNLSFLESLLITAFFATSLNVVNGPAGVWSQRLSVFLIPPVLLLLVLSGRMRPGRPRQVLASISGFVSVLLFTQDFHTAQFALFFVMVGLVLFVAVERKWPFVETVRILWTRETPAARVALVTTALLAAWSYGLSAFGGGSFEILGLRISSRDPRRPALLAIAGLIAFCITSRTMRAEAIRPRLRALLPYAIGGLIGCGVFLWIYAPAYLEHHAFPDDQLLNSLSPRSPAQWGLPLNLLRDLTGYDTQRSFKLVFVLGILAWLPLFKVDRKTRNASFGFLIVSFAVLLVPLRFGDFSMWRVLFEPLPGFSVIRDPKRIAYIYELAVALATAVFLSRLPPRSLARLSSLALVLLLLVTERNGLAFDFLRRNADFDRWVEAPLSVDPSCRSFFIDGASREYMSRSPDTWTLYAMDAMFIALRQSIPTLNGYSAWVPHHWRLSHPERPEYAEAVREWIDRHRLVGVCRLDVDARTMRPDRPGR